MHLITRTTSVAVLVTLGLALMASAAEPPKTASDLDTLIGQPADIAPSAYLYRADRKAAENPPETEFLFTALKHSREGLVVGLLWEEPRPVEQVVLVWPAGGAPKPEQVVLRWFPEGGSASWWCRAGDGTKLRENAKPVVSEDRRVFTYTIQARDNNAALDNLVIAAPANAVPVVKVLAPQKWQRTDLTVEWGLSPGAAKQAFDGRIEIYNGVLGKVTPMAGDPVTKTKDTVWVSPAAAGRRGISVSLLSVGYEETPVWPGQAKLEDVNRTIVTIRTGVGSFSFLPADLARGPILAPEYGFFVRKSADPVTPEQFRKELADKGLKTLREQLATRPEQSWDNAMRAVHTEVKGDFPAYPAPKLSAPAQVSVPEPYLVSAWSVGAGNMMRAATKDKQGKWFFRDPPYQALAHETHLFMRVLDLMGRHEEARDGYEMWLNRVERPVPTPDGLWQGGPGRFFSGIEWDRLAGGGISIIHIGILEHAAVTGDTEWLKRNAAKLNANADWIVQQRHALWKDVPDAGRLWTAGLLPPHNIWDNRVWRSWYESNASFCHALRRHAEVIATVDPTAGQRYAREAEAFAKDLRAAVEESLTVSPVIRTRDGIYRSYLPPAPYMRGPASRFMTANFGAQAFGMSMHTPGLYADAIRGGQQVLEFGILPADDPRMQGYIDVLEDRLLSENFKLFSRFKDYQPERDWFSRAGWYYQAGLERTANLHLVADDPVSFLRTWYNQFAVEVLPAQGWKFKEHTADHGCMDKPFEEAAFLERFRMMLVMERGEALWLARATPRAWLEQGKKISVKNAPTHFGTLAYEIVSDVDNGKINATVEMPSRKAPKEVVLRLRHPKSAPIKAVTVNGKPWTEFNKDKETITLKGLTGQVAVTAQY